jgi:hypothetical protein
MIRNLVNDKGVFNTFINLYDRWQDEREYEDFNDYVKVMQKAVEKVVGDITNVKGSKRPFGLSFKLTDGRNVKLFIKFNGRYCNMAASII